jgi:hypothetical protein
MTREDFSNKSEAIIGVTEVEMEMESKCTRWTNGRETVSSVGITWSAVVVTSQFEATPGDFTEGAMTAAMVNRR